MEFFLLRYLSSFRLKYLFKKLHINYFMFHSCSFLYDLLKAYRKSKIPEIHKSLMSKFADLEESKLHTQLCTCEVKFAYMLTTVWFIHLICLIEILLYTTCSNLS